MSGRAFSRAVTRRTVRSGLPLPLSPPSVGSFCRGSETVTSARGVSEFYAHVWGTSWYEDLDGQRLHQVVNNEIAIEKRIKSNRRFHIDITLIRSFASIINGYYASGVPLELVKGPLEALSVDQVRDLLSSPIFRGLSVDLSNVREKYFYVSSSIFSITSILVK